MAGYIGTKAVNLSTTGADIAGDVDVTGALDVGGAFTSKGIDDNAASTAITIDGSQNVGINTSSPSSAISASSTVVEIADSNLATLALNNTSASKWEIASAAGDFLTIRNDNSEAMRISSGNLLVGKTSTSINTAGSRLIGGGAGAQFTADGTEALALNRLTNDGDLIWLGKAGSKVGSIGNLGTTLFIQTSGNQAGLGFYSGHVSPRKNNAASDNAIDLGRSSQRYDDIFATNGTIQTSDRNEKQDIAELTDAEQRVAVAAKGLMRKFRWRDAVEAKGDNARTHFGIIAQDLQAAFAAEGLDAGDYAMFISTTWWETQTEVPAVEAVAEVLDEDGNVVTEAVEAVDAYTRTDTYDTQEEAPEGATERTRLGVRYSELLAFIIGAL